MRIRGFGASLAANSLLLVVIASVQFMERGFEMWGGWFTYSI